MNIDLSKAKEEFIKYTSNYDIENKSIDRKKCHSFRVMEISKQIATDMKLNQEEIDLATLIGLLHDIGRFEQYKKSKAYNDVESFDHGDYGVKILEKDVRNYIETEEYDEIIKKAVKNHNKFEIEKGLDEKEELFVRIIRDADKIDIIYEGIEIFWENREEEINESTISEFVWEQIKHQQLIKREKGVKIKNIDEVISIIAFIYDINFKESFKILKNNNYINLMLERFKIKDIQTKEKMEEIKNKANKFIELNCKKG